MSAFRKIALPLVLACAAPVATASTIGVQGDPTLEIDWRSSANPTVTRDVGTITFDVDAEGNFIAVNQVFTWGTGDQQDTITIQLANGNLDPFLNFAVGVVDAGAPSIFVFTFTSPIAPTLTGLVNYQLDLAGSFSNGLPNDGGSLATAAPNTAGVLDGLLNATVITGTGAGASFPSGGSSVYGPSQSTGTYDCSLLGGCTSFTARLAFLSSGGGDASSFTGRFEITPVPVPAAVWLLGSALGLLGYLRRRIA